MKLILASSGFSAPESVQQCIEFVGKPADQISFGVINEAYIPYHFPHDWIIHDLVNIYENFSDNIELIPFALELPEILRRLADKDVIFVMGGNTSYLKQTFDQSGFSNVLPGLLKDKVYVGSSAGSMILGHCPTLDTLLKTSGDDDDYSATSYLNLVDLEIIPHIHGKFTLPNAEAQVVIESTRKTVPIYGLSDQAAVIVDDDNVKVIGHDFCVAAQGKIIQESN